MSNSRDDVRSLLEVALEVYRRDVLPEVPKERRFEALMVANAVGIAARAVGAGEGRAAAAIAALAAEAGDGDGADPERALCALVREGAFDPGTPRHEALRAALCEAVAERLAVSNPKADPPAA